ncbi:MAG: DUF4438 domain-containing protein [Chloroflexi bacterium]|nr:DUF4438 domain-containing protein [Chloroflexota bacterium]
MIRTNKDRLVKMAVLGEISPPALRGYGPDNSGRAKFSIGMAGIVYSTRVGDPAFGWEADHLEPGVSIHNADTQADYAMHYLTCVGNEAVVASGDAAGTRGIVSGEHARLLIDFAPEELERMCVGDRIQILTEGLGLAMVDYPHIAVRKCSPQLLEAMRIREAGDGKIVVPVAHELPPQIMGSGMELFPEYVDQDMMTEDRSWVESLGLLSLRLGDLVAIRDQDHSTGRGYQKGAIAIGLINHGDCFQTGHGPGVMTLLSCATAHIIPEIDPDANIGNYLKFGRWA